MKRLGIITCAILTIFVLGIKCEAQSQYSGVISKMENSLFGMDYSTQNDDIRLKRIEEVVYGQPSTSSLDQRVNKLKNDLAADLIGQEIKPKRDTFEEAQDTPKEIIPKPDSNINYPIVNLLEKSVFNKEFKTTDINQRLARLEQQVFQKTYNDDLNSRVDRLKAAVMPERIAQENANEDGEYTGGAEDLSMETSQFQDFNYERPKRIIDGPEYNNDNSVLDNYQGSSDILIPLAAVEKSLLKKSFPDDTTSNRLTRLELSIFNTTFADDDPQTRLDRLASAQRAKKTSSKYDNNKHTQHLSTAMQIGAILLMVLAAIL